MRKSRYSNRAEAIHGKKFVEQPDATVYKSPNDYWKENVRDAESTKQFFRTYHPYLTETMIEAYADYFQRAVRGEVQLPESYLKETENHQKWDYKKEMEEELMSGKIALASRRLENLLKEEEDQDDAAKIKRHEGSCVKLPKRQ